MIARSRRFVIARFLATAGVILVGLLLAVTRYYGDTVVFQ